MLSLVNYGASDSEDDITDEDEAIIAPKVHQNGKDKEIDNSQDTEDLNDAMESTSIINLPQPINQTRSNQIIEEDDDEFLHKKEVPEMAPPKVKQKVKITIPKLSDFKDEEDDKDSGLKYPTASNRKTGLLNMLPKPAHGFYKPSIPAPSKPQAVQKNIQQEIKPQTLIDSSSNLQDSKKKIGFIPYALMDHKKTTDDNKKSSKRKTEDSDDSDEDAGNSFFSFNSKDEDLPKVSEAEIKAMINKETNRIEERKKQAEQSEEMEFENQDYSQQYHQEQQQQLSIDEEAMKALVGGSKAKRSKLSDIQIVDISDQDVLPDKEEWTRKNLAGETSFLATGKIDEKGPSALAKRKHQISYLSMRAEKNMAELEAMWAANRQSNREGRSKYGF
ncbi:unnamed protein product [Chironomus riparius]|uniref:Proline-rich protein PRCC n=1 Tax=Chironomus riparius TaxID=315576 RepID=A0A9N9WTN4_9DIPT|nr:unnamed protein product [Chironomus riparius]